MKKIIALVLALTYTLVLVSCTSIDNTQTDHQTLTIEKVKKLAEKEDADMRYISSIEEVTREETWKEAMIKIAYKMLSQKMDIVTISNITELSEEELRKLAEKQLN